MALASQSSIGPFRLLHLVKAGPTCQIWSALDDRTRQQVALKVAASGARREVIRMLRRELRAGEALANQHVLAPREMYQDGQMACLAMDYFPAINLRDALVQAPQRLAAALDEVVGQMAAAVAHVHQCGWVHRDLKPENFLWSETGEIRLIDFALAAPRPARWARLWSCPRSIQGTRSYVSPEQVRRLPAEFRSDIYSLGCTWYHLAVGQPPYSAASSDALLHKHLRAPVPLAEVASRAVTCKFSRLLEEMMAKSVFDRPASMSHVLYRVQSLRVLRPAAADDTAAGAQSVRRIRSSAARPGA